jgi:hypothetical protein
MHDGNFCFPVPHRFFTIVYLVHYLQCIDKLCLMNACPAPCCTQLPLQVLGVALAQMSKIPSPT